MSRQSPRDDAVPMVALTLLSAIAFLVNSSGRAVDLLLPLLAADFRSTVGRVAAIVSAYTIPYGLFQLGYGPLGDRLGKVRVMTVALIAFAVATAACGLAPTLPALVGLRFLAGASAAALIPLSMSYIAGHVPYELRQAILGRYLAGIAFGQLLGASLSGIASIWVGWRGVFLLYGAAALVAWGLLVLRAGPNRRHERAAQDTQQDDRTLPWGATYWRLLQDPLVRIVIGGVFVEGVFLFGGLSYLGAWLRDRFGLSFVVIGLLLGSFGLGGLAYSRVVGPLVRRLGERGLILTGGGLATLCYLAIAALHLWPLFLPLNILLGFGYNLMHGTMQTKATELAPSARGTAIALFAFSLFLGQGVGAALLGRIVDDAGFAATFATSGIATGLLAGLLTWALGWQDRRQVGREPA